MKVIIGILFILQMYILPSTVKVTFQVNMKVQMKKGLFTASDSVVVRGDFQVDAGDVENWQGNRFKLTDPNADSIYTIDVNFPDTKVGTTYKFIFVKNDGGWEPDLNRKFTLQNVINQILPAPFFANDSIIINYVTNTINFTADLSDIYGIGNGYFDPNQDSILVVGLDWNNMGTYISGNRRMHEVLSPAKRFKTTLTIRGEAGDSTSWKFHAYPPQHFANSGWELGNDRWFKYAADGATVNLPELKPNFFPEIPVTLYDVHLQLICNMGQFPRNRYNASIIPVDQIQFVAVKGGIAPLGNWAGNWTVQDTAGSNRSLILLNDDGLQGDQVAGDHIWTTTIVLPAGTSTGRIQFRFGCMYPGADTINGGLAYLDNELHFGMNHYLLIYANSTSVVSKSFWPYADGVVEKQAKSTTASFRLEQNFPNPFNPVTKVFYTIPDDGDVQLDVYNSVGELILEVFNGFQLAGTYSAEINGYNFPSGMYYYKLRTGEYSATRKMVLLK